MKRRQIIKITGIGIVSLIIPVSCNIKKIRAKDVITNTSDSIVRKPIEYFTPNLSEPSDYKTALPDFLNAYICSKIAQLSRKEALNTDENSKYQKNVMVTLKNWGFDRAAETQFLDSTNENPNSCLDTQGLILFHQDTAFIVLRSTEKKLKDWLTNFSIDKENNPYGEGKVHSGFLNAFKAILPAINVERLRTTKNIWITGHSLGGGLASIVSSFMIDSRIPVAGIYTFGAPRVGDGDYRDYINRNLKYKYWRFINKKDLVADIPLSYIFSREGFMLNLLDEDYEILRWIDKDGEKHKTRNFDGKSTTDHEIEKYQNRLLDLARKQDPSFIEMKYYEVVPNLELGTSDEDRKVIEEIQEIEKDYKTKYPRIHQRTRRNLRAFLRSFSNPFCKFQQ